jgi:hypothetical protein
MIFRLLGIKVFTIWDSDRDKQHKSRRDVRNVFMANRKLLHLHERAPEDWPEGRIFGDHAIWDPSLEKVIERELVTAGLNQDDVLAVVENQVGSRDLKKYAVVEEVIRQSAAQCAFPYAQAVIENILAFHNS